MVTKHETLDKGSEQRLNLAKIHMVTKLGIDYNFCIVCLNLAKIHMVTKPQTYFNICI